MELSVVFWSSCICFSIIIIFWFLGDLQCPKKCHPNAQCVELVVGGRKCVCNPGFEGDGIECAGKMLFVHEG